MLTALLSIPLYGVAWNCDVSIQLCAPAITFPTIVYPDLQTQEKELEEYTNSMFGSGQLWHAIGSEV
jgi:hypothetical protein